MPTTRRSRTIQASADEVWELIEDPHHMPRWWPGVKRMEDVQGDRWTQVFTTKKGRAVRLDFRLLDSEPPGPGGEPAGVRRWEQELYGTPFERVLSEAITELAVEAAADGSRVTITQIQKLRGYSRTGGFLLKRATRTRLDEALDGLEQALR
jgi:carbon monoxide dehydrogenase subunit G